MPREVNPSAENDILANIPGLDDEPAGGGGTPENNGGDGETSQITEENAGGEAGVESEETEVSATQQQSGNRGGGNPDTTRQQQPQQKQQNNKGNIPPRQPANSAGDLVDQAGRVIARAGNERRFYESWRNAAIQLQRAGREMQTRDQRIQQLEGQLRGHTEAANAPQSLGLNPQEAVAGMRLFAQFKRSPVDTLKFMLAEVQSLGHDLTGIIDGGVNAQAISTMLDRRLAPLMSQHQQQQREAQQRNEIDQQVNSFYNEFPDAQVHDAALGELLTRNPTLTPREAYFMLQNHYIKNGWDWSVPLNVIMTQQRAPARQPAQQTQMQQRQSLPNGRGARTAQQPQTRAVGQDELAHEDDSWENIIRGSMRNSGLRV